ncbi:MAG: hypothetical protein WBA12_07385 [Catalinimonas sp.]
MGLADCELDPTAPELLGKLSRTLEREPDFVCVMRRPDGGHFLLHIEFQTADDPQMLLRVQEYHALLQRKLSLPVRHFVIYLGRHPPRMATQLPKALRFGGFELKDIGTYDPERLLASQVPEDHRVDALPARARPARHRPHHPTATRPDYAPDQTQQVRSAAHHLVAVA